MIQSDNFKHIIGKFPTGICVISTLGSNGLLGFTANSFTSVSLNPQLISFCLNKNGSSIIGFRNSNKFAISILSSTQQKISNHFASKVKNKFMNISHVIGEYSRAGLINEAVSHIECSKYKEIECGDHFIFIGEVKYMKVDDKKSPLIYFEKEYHKLF